MLKYLLDINTISEPAVQRGSAARSGEEFVTSVVK
jgi:hypothetical protein